MQLSAESPPLEPAPLQAAGLRGAQCGNGVPTRRSRAPRGEMAFWGLRGLGGGKERAGSRPGHPEDAQGVPSGEGAWPRGLRCPKQALGTAGPGVKVRGPGRLYRSQKAVSGPPGLDGDEGLSSAVAASVTTAALSSKVTVLAPAWRGWRWGRLEGCGAVGQLHGRQLLSVPGQCLSSCLWVLSCWWMPFAEPELPMAWDLSG